MPVQICSEKGKPGYKFGKTGKCYVYLPNNEVSRKKAKKRAVNQGIAINFEETLKGFELTIAVDEFVRAVKGY